MQLMQWIIKFLELKFLDICAALYMDDMLICDC